MLLSSLILLIACGGDDSKESSPADTATNAGGDTGNDTDTGTDTAADTGDDSGADTAVEEASPYADCIETATISTGGMWTADYDARGRMRTNAYVYSWGTGTITYAWDADGNLLSKEDDGGNDDTVDQGYYYAYDEDGRQVFAEYRYLSGYYNRIETTYNADGSTTAITYNLEGTRTGRTDTTYTAYGYPEEVAVDFTGDDVPEQVGRYTYVYDAGGRALEQRYDFNVDGTVDNLYTFTYDADGRMLTQLDTLPSNPDWSSYYAWTYDAAGNVLTYFWENSYGGTMEIVSTYDADGRIVQRTQDDMPLGSVDSTVTWTYSCP